MFNVSSRVIGILLKFIAIEKLLIIIQVRCSLEDVADNMISNLKARGEKDMRITYEVSVLLRFSSTAALKLG